MRVEEYISLPAPLNLQDFEVGTTLVRIFYFTKYFLN
jgi:hypothetical protein